MCVRPPFHEMLLKKWLWLSNRSSQAGETDRQTDSLLRIVSHQVRRLWDGAAFTCTYTVRALPGAALTLSAWLVGAVHVSAPLFGESQLGTHNADLLPRLFVPDEDVSQD